MGVWDGSSGEDAMSWQEREAKRFEVLLAERWLKDGTPKIQMLGKAKEAFVSFTRQIDHSKFASVEVAESKWRDLCDQ